MYIGDRRLKA